MRVSRLPAAARASHPAPTAPERATAKGESASVSSLKRIQAAVADSVHPLRVWRNPAAPPAADTGGLRLATFNIEKGKKIEDVERELQALRPDVACLQEVDEATARRLGAKLGMHVAFYGMERGYTRTCGKAILSRHPFAEVRNLTYKNSWLDRLRTWFNDPRKTEALETRSALSATLQIGSRRVEVLDTHLSLTDTASNAKQLEQLAAIVEERQRAGRPVVLAGDFNVNFALAGGGVADAPGKVATATDTLSEFEDRYGGFAGNIADPRVKAAADRLEALMQSHWEAPVRTVETDAGSLTPEQARAELAAGKVPRGSAREKQLLRVMDGISHLSARKRFDNVFVSRDLRVTSTHIDQRTRASDHQPVVTEIRWD